MQALTRSFNIILIVVLLGMIFTASGCSKADDNGVTVGQKVDRAIDDTNAAADRARVQLADAARKADEKVHEDAQKAKEAFHDDADAAKMKPGEAHTAVDDAAITASVRADLLKDPDLSVLKVDVSTDQGEVKLTGKVDSASAKQRATEMVRAVDGVREVDNQLVVASNGKPDRNG
jgi:osmotically-inducible protein OsmY